MEYGLFDGLDDTKHNSVGLVENSKIYGMLDDFFNPTWFDGR